MSCGIFGELHCMVINLNLQAPTQYFHNEQPLDLNGATCAGATDYTKRPHVFRLKMASGGEWLFQCRDDVSLWIIWYNFISGTQYV